MYKSNPSFLRQQSHNLASNQLLLCKYGEKDSVPINQNPSKDFNIDPDTGRPMQEISALLRAQSAAEQMAIFSGLDEFKSNYLPKDVSDEEAIKFMMPRYCQLPSQVSEFVANLQTDRDMRSLQEKLNESKKDVEAKQEDSSPVGSVAADASGTSSSSN